jgi:putative FmdB family regulatory protein
LALTALECQKRTVEEPFVPTYAYACTQCGHRFEAVQSFSDASLTECPACTGRLRKVFSPVGVVFKGSGFYRTDSRKGASSNGKKEPATTGSSSSSGSADGSSGRSSGGSSGGSSGTKANPSSSDTGTTTPTRAAS